jgi:His/Glu/Gln/Arg/opine family amino acid ABC transporter permease subunit
MFDYTFYWSLVWDKLPDLLQGALVTVQITAFSMLAGSALAIPLALARLRERGISYRIATTWVEIARNTPALFQIYMAYFGTGSLGLHLSSYLSLFLAITFNNAGYLAETFRGGIKTVPPQQTAAARSLGMSQGQAFLRVVFPQVFRLVFFPFINQLNWALLNSSLGMIIGLQELTGATESAQSESFRTFEFFVVTAGIYYAISKLVTGMAYIFARGAMRD